MAGIIPSCLLQYKKVGFPNTFGGSKFKQYFLGFQYIYLIELR